MKTLADGSPMPTLHSSLGHTAHTFFDDCSKPTYHPLPSIATVASELGCCPVLSHHSRMVSQGSPIGRGLPFPLSARIDKQQHCKPRTPGAMHPRPRAASMQQPQSGGQQQKYPWPLLFCRTGLVLLVLHVSGRGGGLWSKGAALAMWRQPGRGNAWDRC